MFYCSTQSKLRRGLAANVSSSSFGALTDTLVQPSGSGVVEVVGDDETVIPPGIKVYPVGVGSENDVYSLRVTGWNLVLPTDGDTRPVWHPTVLAEASCTLSALVGVAGGIVPATERYADTISIVALRQAVVFGLNNADAIQRGSVVIFSPTNDLSAYLIVPTFGHRIVQFQFDQTTGTPTGNVLWSPYGSD